MRPPTRLPLQAPDSHLDRRIAFRLLELVAQILAAHLQFVLMAPALQKVVGGGPDQQNQRGLPCQLEHLPRGESQQAATAAVQEGGKPHPVARQKSDGEIHDRGGRQQRFQRAADRIQREQLSQAGRGVQPVQVRGQSGGRKDQSTLRDPAKRGDQPAEARGQRDSAKDDEIVAPCGQQLVGTNGSRVQFVTQQAAPVSGKCGQLPGQKHHGSHGSKAGDEIAAARDLPLLSRFLPLSRCGLLRLVLVCHKFSVHEVQQAFPNGDGLGKTVRKCVRPVGHHNDQHRETQ